MTADLLVLDLETVPDLTVWSPPVDQPDAMPPQWACRIVCAGHLRLSGVAFLPVADPDVMLARDATEERQLLVALSALLASTKPTVVTWNGRRFDMPVVALRSFAHGVQLPWYFRTRGARYRYDEGGHLDLADCLSDYGASTMLSLDNASRLAGLPGKGEIDGGHVETLYREARHDQIAAYCLGDVLKTALLLMRFKLVQGELSHAQHAAIVEGVARVFRAGKEKAA